MLLPNVISRDRKNGKKVLLSKKIFKFYFTETTHLCFKSLGYTLESILTLILVSNKYYYAKIDSIKSLFIIFLVKI